MIEDRNGNVIATKTEFGQWKEGHVGDVRGSRLGSPVEAETRAALDVLKAAAADIEGGSAMRMPVRCVFDADTGEVLGAFVIDYEGVILEEIV